MKIKCTIGITRVVRVGSSYITALNMVFSVVWCLMSLIVTFPMTLLMNKFTNIVINDG